VQTPVKSGFVAPGSVIGSVTVSVHLCQMTAKPNGLAVSNGLKERRLKRGPCHLGSRISVVQRKWIIARGGSLKNFL
jgi:hypothetical protein